MKAQPTTYRIPWLHLHRDQIFWGINLATDTPHFLAGLDYGSKLRKPLNQSPASGCSMSWKYQLYMRAWISLWNSFIFLSNDCFSSNLQIVSFPGGVPFLDILYLIIFHDTCCTVIVQVLSWEQCSSVLWVLSCKLNFPHPQFYSHLATKRIISEILSIILSRRSIHKIHI